MSITSVTLKQTRFDLGKFPGVRAGVVLGPSRPEPPSRRAFRSLQGFPGAGALRNTIGTLVGVSIREGESRPDAPDGPGDEPPRHRLLVRLERVRARVRANPMLNTTWRLLVFTVGCVVLLGGLIMMIGPGPGIVAIILGLAILATEFAWAQHLLRRAKEAAERAKETAFDPRKRRRNQILLVIAVVLAAAAIIAYLQVFGLTLPWELLNRP